MSMFPHFAVLCFPFILFCFKAPDVRPKGRKTGRVRNSSSPGQAQMRHEVEKPNHLGLEGFCGTLALLLLDRVTIHITDL